MSCDFLQNNNKLTEFLLQGTIEQNIPVSFKSKFNKRGNKKHICIRLVGLGLEGKNYRERNTVKKRRHNEILKTSAPTNHRLGGAHEGSDTPNGNSCCAT